MIEVARPTMEAIAREIASVNVVKPDHDINTVTVEEVVLFTIAESPADREIRKK